MVDIEKILIVPRVEIKGKGAFILTGPSSCGKGEVAKALCDALSIPPARWLSMGTMLRQTYERAYAMPEFARTLSEKYKIGIDTPMLDCLDTTQEIKDKVSGQREDLTRLLTQRRGTEQGDDAWESVTQLEWLEYCTTHGLLVPNRWTQALIEAHVELFSLTTEQPFIVDGYPRTKGAAVHLLDIFQRYNIPVLKVLHLSISKQQMLKRAGKRQRLDDNIDSLLKRYEFYVESVQPSVDYLKEQLGADQIALIDAHQPHYDIVDGEKVFNLHESINNVVRTALINVGLSRILSDALVASRK